MKNGILCGWVLTLACFRSASSQALSDPSGQGGQLRVGRIVYDGIEDQPTPELQNAIARYGEFIDAFDEADWLLELGISHFEAADTGIDTDAQLSFAENAMEHAIAAYLSTLPEDASPKESWQVKYYASGIFNNLFDVKQMQGKIDEGVVHLIRSEEMHRGLLQQVEKASRSTGDNGAESTSLKASKSGASKQYPIKAVANVHQGYADTCSRLGLVSLDRYDTVKLTDEMVPVVKENYVLGSVVDWHLFLREHPDFRDTLLKQERLSRQYLLSSMSWISRSTASLEWLLEFAPLTEEQHIIALHELSMEYENMAVASSFNGNHDDATEYFTKAIKLSRDMLSEMVLDREKFEAVKRIGDLQVRMAEASMLSNNYKRATIQYMAAMEWCNTYELEVPRQQFLELDDEGARSLVRMRKALAEYAKEVEEDPTKEDKVSEADVRSVLGTVYYAFGGNMDLATKHIYLALELYESIPHEERPEDLPRKIARLHYTLSRTLYQKAEFLESARYRRDALEWFERAGEKIIIDRPQEALARIISDMVTEEIQTKRLESANVNMDGSID